MKIAAVIAGLLLGLLFAFASLMFLLNLAEGPAPEPGSPTALFMGALAPTGYLTFIKACELIGALLVAVPKTRALGLLVLGPIIVNILAFHVFIARGAHLFDPMVVLAVGLAAFLLWCERARFAPLLR